MQLMFNLRPDSAATLGVLLCAATAKVSNSVWAELRLSATFFVVDTPHIANSLGVYIDDLVTTGAISFKWRSKPSHFTLGLFFNPTINLLNLCLQLVSN